MKKEYFILSVLIISIFSAIFFSHLSLAETPDDIIQSQIGINPGNIPSSPEEAKNITTSYLQKEWGKILEKNPVAGPIHRFLLAISPAFKAILGVEYALSWAFVFAICIWLFLFVILYPVASQIFSSTPAGLLAAFIISSLVGLAGVIKRAVDMLTFAINNTWIAWLSLLIAIIAIMIASYFGKEIKQYLKNQKEQEAKEKTNQDREVISANAKVSKKELEEYERSTKDEF